MLRRNYYSLIIAVDFFTKIFHEYNIDCRIIDGYIDICAAFHVLTRKEKESRCGDLNSMSSRDH